MEATATQSPPSHNRRAIIWIAIIVVAAIVVWRRLPDVILAFKTVSTDDAYVNGHVTFVAPRVRGQVVWVFVDDNNTVRTGDLLVQLDKQPYQTQVEQRRAAVALADAALQQARAQARATEAAGRAARFNLQNAIDQVNASIQELRSNVAQLDRARALLETAQAQFDEIAKIEPQEAASRLELELKRDALARANAGVRVAEASIRQTRHSLGLGPDAPAGASADSVPADLSQGHPAVRSAMADLMQKMAELGVPLPAATETPAQLLDSFNKMESSGDLEAWRNKLVDDAPMTRLAAAQREQAARELELAELDLKYTDVIAEFDGVVSRRNVNPGDVVQPGQSLMAVRANQELWVDANFKETQLRNLRIGQRVECFTDAYGDRRVFKGRISGFSIGTGATLSLLPPENATGNYVKVVQRLPVRIDLDRPLPDDTPLFIGLSVTPFVYYREPPSGPNAGKMLQAPIRISAPTTTP